MYISALYVYIRQTSCHTNVAGLYICTSSHTQNTLYIHAHMHMHMPYSVYASGYHHIQPDVGYHTHQDRDTHQDHSTPQDHNTSQDHDAHHHQNPAHEDENEISDNPLKRKCTPFRMSVLCCLSVCVVVGYVVFLYFILLASDTISQPPCAIDIQLPKSSGCNGDAALCNRRYSDVAQGTMHNAFATVQDGILFAQHRACMRTALVSGIRAFMLDVHMTTSGELKLCHVVCSIGSVSLSNTLDMFYEFLTLNPREIVAIIWEVGYDGKEVVSDADKQAHKDLLAKALLDAKLFPFLHTQSKNVMWPTLDTMITSDSRLVSFTDHWLDNAGWDLYLWDHAFETPYDNANINDIRNNCKINRGIASNSLFIVNHFLVLGALGVNTKMTSLVGNLLDIDAIQDINKNPFMWEHIGGCANCLDKFPNFVVVDFWASSDVMKVVASLNSLTVPMKQSELPPVQQCLSVEPMVVR